MKSVTVTAMKQESRSLSMYIVKRSTCIKVSVLLEHSHTTLAIAQWQPLTSYGLAERKLDTIYFSSTIIHNVQCVPEVLVPEAEIPVPPPLLFEVPRLDDAPLLKVDLPLPLLVPTSPYTLSSPTPLSTPAVYRHSGDGGNNVKVKVPQSQMSAVAKALHEIMQRELW
jgi:hypothetical protein